jgi:hypothetical protein
LKHFAGVEFLAAAVTGGPDGVESQTLGHSVER